MSRENTALGRTGLDYKFKKMWKKRSFTLHILENVAFLRRLCVHFKYHLIILRPSVLSYGNQNVVTLTYEKPRKVRAQQNCNAGQLAMLKGRPIEAVFEMRFEGGSIRTVTVWTGRSRGCRQLQVRFLVQSGRAGKTFPPEASEERSWLASELQSDCIKTMLTSSSMVTWSFKYSRHPCRK